MTVLSVCMSVLLNTLDVTALQFEYEIKNHAYGFCGKIAFKRAHVDMHRVAEHALLAGVFPIEAHS